MAKNPGSVRSGQLVTTYGVGSLIAAGDESFIVAGIEDWPTHERFEMHEPGSSEFARESLYASSVFRSGRQPRCAGAPVPRQHSCPQCHRLNDIMFFNNQFGENTCTL